MRRSLLVGANTISPELAVACLTVCIYVWNCRGKKQTHSNNQRVYPIVPPECFIGSSGVSDTFVPVRNAGIHSVPNCFGRKQVSYTLEDQEVNITIKISNANKAEDLTTDEIFSYILKRALQLQEAFHSLNSQSVNRGMTFGSFPMYEIEQHASLIRMQKERLPQYNNLEFMLENGRNTETLLRNLQSFSLTIDNVVGDGNCCFHSITVQLSKLINLHSDENIKNFVATLKGMGFGKSAKEDASLLRSLFIQELANNVDGYKDWIDLEESNFLQEVSYLQQEGSFSSNLADLCVKVCSNVLGFPIIVITSYAGAPYFFIFSDSNEFFQTNLHRF